MIESAYCSAYYETPLLCFWLFFDGVLYECYRSKGIIHLYNTDTNRLHDTYNVSEGDVFFQIFEREGINYLGFLEYPKARILHYHPDKIIEELVECPLDHPIIVAGRKHTGILQEDEVYVILSDLMSDYETLTFKGIEFFFSVEHILVLFHILLVLSFFGLIFNIQKTIINFMVFIELILFSLGVISVIYSIL